MEKGTLRLMLLPTLEADSLVQAGGKVNPHEMTRKLVCGCEELHGNGDRRAQRYLTIAYKIP